MNSQNLVFEELYVRLMEIGNKPSDKTILFDLLTKLNSLNYNENIKFITTWTCTDLLLHVISLLKEFGKEESYLTLLCQLIVNVASKQKVVISSMSVNVILHGLKDVWFEVLALCSFTNTSKDCFNQLLTAIAAVVYGNGAYIMSDILEWLTGKDGKGGSIGELLLSPVSIDLKKLSLQCLSGLCITSESRESLDDTYLHYCLQLFIQALQCVPSVKDVPHYRTIFASHKGIQYILDGPSCIHVDEIGPLLAILKKHLVFGLGTPSADLPEVLTPIPIPSVINPESLNSVYTSKPRSTKKKRKKSRHKLSQAQNKSRLTSSNGQNESPPLQLSGFDESQASISYSMSNLNQSQNFKFHVPSSESEYSDTEGGQLSSLTSFALKIRQMAIGSLYSIVKKTSKVLMLGYWNSFLSCSSQVNDVSLLSCIANDPAPKARVGALMVLSALLDGSKTYLTLGIQKGDSSAFISFSSMLALYVCNVHHALLKALAKERSTLVLVHILKTLSTLAANTPYSKLSCGFISNIFAQVKTVMSSSRDIDTRIGVLNVYISLLGCDSSLPEVSNCITSQIEIETPCSSACENTQSETIVKSWLIEDCLTVFKPQVNTPLPVQIACLHLIATASKMYFQVAKHYFTEISSLICLTVCDENATVRLHASNLAVDFGASLLHSQQQEKNMIEKGVLFWQQILSGSLPKVVENMDDPVSKSLMCNSLSTMGSEVFNSLDQRQQIYCQTLLLGLTADENYLVRSASIRALAVYIMYPMLRKDVAFVEDVAIRILKLMKDQAKGVQYNAAWSFGNFTDAIIINVENDSQSFPRSTLRKPLLVDMIQCAITSFDSKDRVRFNMMRVLGNIMRFCDQVHFSDERLRKLMLEAKSIMVNAITRDPLMKVRWNACLACGNMLRNVNLPVGEPAWTSDVYKALTVAVLSSKNYKVSIKAAIALGCPPNRAAFGNEFQSLYVSVLRSLKNSETNEVDIGEYKFKDQLQERLIYTLLHMTSFIDAEDLPSIVLVLSDQMMYECVQAQLRKCFNALFNEHKLANLTLDDGADSYAALGQLSLDKKKDLFATASAQWRSVCKTACDTESSKNVSEKFDVKYLEIFPLEA